MKVTPEMNGGSLPYPGGGKLPACLKKYNSVLAVGGRLEDGTLLCYAYSPKQKPKNPVCSFIFNPDCEPSVRIFNECRSASVLSAATVINPLDTLFGEERAEKLQEMYVDGFAAW